LTPHLDRLAAEGMRFTHYYGQASCRAGLASFSYTNQIIRPFFVDDHAGKPEAIQLFISQRPLTAFGNATGDQTILEWATVLNCLCITPMPSANTHMAWFQTH